MKAKWFAAALFVAPLCGCTEDLDHLKAIGAKLANRAPQADKLGKMPWSDTARQLHSALSRDPIVHRVSYRLHFDKDLVEEKVITELKGPGQIELTGYVSSENHRERAGEIASRTLGVEEVVNNLKVGRPENGSPGERGNPGDQPSENPTKEPVAKPDPASGSQATPAPTTPEKGNPAPKVKSTPQPGSNPVPGRPVGNPVGSPQPGPASVPGPTGTQGSPPPALGAPVTIPPVPPPAPEKK